MRNVSGVLVAALLILLCLAAGPGKGGFRRVKPAAAGLSADSLARVDALLQQAVDSQWIAGAVALVAREGRIAYTTTVGMRDIAAGDPMAFDDRFRIASMTKPITSLAILQLYEAGKLRFDDPVAKYIPAFGGVQVLDSVDLRDTTWYGHPARETLTIHHLLTHTSGICYSFSDTTISKLYAKAGILEIWTLWPATLADNIDKLARLPLKHEPGAAWTYGLSTDVLGRVVEVVSGQPLDQYMREHIFDPLGMDDTGFYFDSTEADRLTTLYSNHPTYKLVPIPDQPARGMSGNTPVAGAKTYFSGGGGLTSTAEDYLRFCQAVLDGGVLHGTRIIADTTLRHMRENKIGALWGDIDHFSYGYSLTTARSDLSLGRRPGRLSWGGAFQTTFWIDPERRAVVMLLTQVIPSLHQDKLYTTFERRVNAAWVR
ncbi:MAG: serine hydrolase domain-containing protein [Bacteroidia bacterium]